jgi:hypothetical protein
MLTIHSLFASDCQTRRTSRPYGRNASAMLANAASGSPKNTAFVRLMATSNDASSKG